MRTHVFFLSLMLAIVAVTGLLALAPALADGGQPAPQTSPTAEQQTLAADTQVTVSLKQPVSSSTATVGDIVPITVDQDVVVGGIVMIAKGADGQATVTTVEHAGGNGHGGKLVLTMNWVYAVDGTKIDLASASQNSESGDKKGSASTATIASYALLGPIGLFAHNLVHGKEVTIGTDKTFSMYTDHNVNLHVAHPLAASSPSPAASPVTSN